MMPNILGVRDALERAKAKGRTALAAQIEDVKQVKGIRDIMREDDKREDEAAKVHATPMRYLRGE